MARIRRMGTEENHNIVDDDGNIIRRGIAARDQAKSLRNTMTAAESILWEKLQGKRLHGTKFYRQVSIDKYTVDFFCPRKKVVIEVDGSVHDNDVQKEYDTTREEVLRKYGVRKILRIRNEEVYNQLPAALERIAIACGAPSPRSKKT